MAQCLSDGCENARSENQQLCPSCQNSCSVFALPPAAVVAAAVHAEFIAEHPELIPTHNVDLQVHLTDGAIHDFKLGALGGRYKGRFETTTTKAAVDMLPILEGWSGLITKMTIVGDVHKWTNGRILLKSGALICAVEGLALNGNIRQRGGIKLLGENDTVIRILYEEKPAPHIEFKVVHKTARKPANEISIMPLLANATPIAGMVYTGDVTPPASPGNSTHRAFHGGAAEVMASLGDHQGYHGP